MVGRMKQDGDMIKFRSTFFKDLDEIKAEINRINLIVDNGNIDMQTLEDIAKANKAIFEAKKRILEKITHE